MPNKQAPILKRFIKALFKWLLFLGLSFSLSLAVACYFFLKELSKELPDISRLAHAQYQIPLTIYSREGLLIDQFGEKKRMPIDIHAIPAQQINAFLAAEDERFYQHPGVDFIGLARAANQFLATGQKRQGGSTITMQVARNFLLSKEKTFLRKLKEILLALQIEQRYSKQQILELYLNKIYLGQRAYGLAAAAQVYYGKNLHDLSLAQQAMLAGLPKAPSIYNPIVNPRRALERRNYVLRRMLELNFIHASTYQQALKTLDDAANQPVDIELDAPYIAEMARKELVEQYGDEAYTLGLKVYTTISAKLQKAADNALRHTLHLYDERYNYRGLPHKKFNPGLDFSVLKNLGDCKQAVIQTVTVQGLLGTISDGSDIQIPWQNIPWHLAETRPVGSHIFRPGDIIWTRQLANQSWALSQIPAAEGALAALDPNNGAILAVSGGFDFYRSRYNRATQSKRQPGSGFKPFIYTAALEKGFTPASIINDAPIVIKDPSLPNDWRPENYTRKFLGPIPLRIALRQSVNLVSIRLLQDIGIPFAVETAMRFGFNREQLPTTLSLALGSGYAPPLKMAEAYAVFANGGFQVKPYLIDRIEDHAGQILFQAKPPHACTTPECGKPENTILAPRVISQPIHFLMNSLLRDVVDKGTATMAKQLGRNDLAGKTGTTNDQRDAWFNGFTADIVASVWMGFDDSRPLGRGETGGKAALPMWIEFMRTALAGLPEKQLVVPDGIEQAYINRADGLLLTQDNKNGEWEYFTSGTAPKAHSIPTPMLEVNQEWLQESLF